MNKLTAHQAAYEVERIEKNIRHLANTLFQLAPYDGNAGPAFISLSREFHPAAEYESMLGCAFVDAYLSDIFAGVATNDNISDSAMGDTLQYDHLVDGVSQYIEERSSDTHNNFGRGRGSIARFERLKKLRPSFTDANMPNLELRKHIESHIALLLRERDSYASTLSL